MKQQDARDLPSLSGRSDSRHSADRFAKTASAGPAGNRYANLEFLKATIDEMGNVSERGAKEELLKAIRKKVKDQYDTLYTQYDMKRAVINSEIRGLQQKRGLEAEVAFIKRQNEAQKKRLNDLVFQLRQRERILEKLRLKDEELVRQYTESKALEQRFRAGLEEQQRLRQGLNDADYERAVVEDMVQTRRKQVEYSRDLLVERYQTLSGWLQKLGSGQVKTIELEKRVDSITKAVRRANEGALRDFQINKLNDEFKTVLQHELEEYLGKTAIREILVHEREIEEAKDRQEREDKQRKLQALRELREQEAARLLEEKRSVEQRLLAQEDQYSQVRKGTAVSSIERFLPQNFNQSSNKQTLEQVKDRLLAMRQELRAKVESVGSTLDARNVQTVQLAKSSELESLNKAELKTTARLNRLTEIIEKCCLLTSKLGTFAEQSEELKRDAIGGHLGRVSLLLEKKRLAQQHV